MSAPLSGFHFLEVGRGASLAYAGRLLVLLGADVTVVAGGTVPLERLLGDRLVEGKSVLVGGDGLLPAGEVPGAALSGALVGEGASVGGSGAHPVVVSTPEPAPEADWARSGLMELTGEVHGPPLAGPPGVMVAARGAALALRLLRRLIGGPGGGGGGMPFPRLDGPALLGERAALGGLSRGGRTSPSGSTRLLPAVDGWVALTLARPSDLDALAAWMGRCWQGDHWRAVSEHLARTEVTPAVQRAQLLAIPAAAARGPEQSFDDSHAAARGQRWPPSPYLIDGRRPRPPCPSTTSTIVPGQTRRPRPRPPGTVADLSALWAGPLCASLLPGRVVKVESRDRLDGARFGPRAFFDLLNGTKESLLLDFSSPEELGVLRRLVGVASVVVESSRSRALESLGLDPSGLAEHGRTPGWLRISGYGSSGPWRDRVAFGDDAAAAGGLAAETGRLASGTETAASGRPEVGAGPLNCGDAVADPLTGLHAAVAGAALQVGGGGHEVEVAMREVVGHALWAGEELDASRVVPAGRLRVRAPRARRPVATAPPPGADRDRLIAWLGTASSRGPARTAAS